MTPIPTSSSASAPNAEEEETLPPLPRTPREAFWFLEAAALYLRESYFSEEHRKNDGWGEKEGARQAYSILTHCSSQLIVEEQAKIWTPNSEEKKL